MVRYLFQLTRIISVVSSTHSKIKAPTLPPSVIHHHRVFNRAAKFNRIIHQPEETNLPGSETWATVSESQFFLHPSYADVRADVRAYRKIKQCKGDTMYVLSLATLHYITSHYITMHYNSTGNLRTQIFCKQSVFWMIVPTWVYRSGLIVAKWCPNFYYLFYLCFIDTESIWTCHLLLHFTTENSTTENWDIRMTNQESFELDLTFQYLSLKSQERNSLLFQ